MEFIMFALLAVFIGMRHGIDGDHVAAIADMVGSEQRKKKQLTLGVMYAIGHGMIVMVIGVLFIYIGLQLPEATKQVLEMLVSFTLILLGVFIIWSIFQQKKDYEYKSRLRIVVEFFHNLTSKVTSSTKSNPLSPTKLGAIGAFIIGILHGIGVESPTQIAIISNAMGLDNITVALIQLTLFVIGLLVATIGMTFCLSWGFMKARVKDRLFLLLGTVTGTYSLGLGIFMMVELVKGGA
ncbi:High-affinity nickel-transporter [Robertmurraya korlensis]|uniref:HoxN/HupN/NixA family nickel/cobalt transporter n=1 Tax=Robertmurraya korlensis TaxID=519977 RepID=UPI002040005A|nr:High-affinity nickel-transporter [Robertmurraya korlensis]MCM3601308.1 High-affinity nickel-transporter [Robertmurraya korlensis]